MKHEDPHTYIALGARQICADVLEGVLVIRPADRDHGHGGDCILGKLAGGSGAGLGLRCGGSGRWCLRHLLGRRPGLLAVNLLERIAHVIVKASLCVSFQNGVS